MKLWTLIGLLLLAPPATAANWLKGCQATVSQARMSLKPGSFACIIPTSATDNSNGMLGVSACENIDLLFWPDVDGDGVASGGTGLFRSCPDPDMNGATAGDGTGNGEVGETGCWIIENVTLTGVPPNAEAIYGVAANWIFWEQVTYTTTTEPIRAIVRCNGPGE